MVRVLIVEDQDMTRKLFEIMVSEMEGYQVVRSIPNAALAPFYCRQGGIDLVLMDVYTEMDASGLEASEWIKQKCPEVKIIIVTSIPEFSWLERARSIGVESFWYKNLTKEPLQSLMDRTMAGESVYPDAPPEVQLGEAGSSEFTRRELEILQKLTMGASNTEIAEELGISAITVRNHIHSMMEKTGYRSRTELAVNARARGLAIGDL